VEVVVGLSLKNLKPNVWDPESEYYLEQVQAVMISYADLDDQPWHRRNAMENGLHEHFGIPHEVKIYLDNGSYNFSKNGNTVPRDEYEAFVEAAAPDWHPIPQDYIPAPAMDREEQRGCLEKTMDVNAQYTENGYVPVMHVSRVLDEYLDQFAQEDLLEGDGNDRFAVGGIVPNLLRAHKALKYRTVLDGLRQIRGAFAEEDMHLYGVGGTSTLHVAALLDIDSVDSAGWRNRAARGIIQLPGGGDRSVADLGSWNGRELDDDERKALAACKCPVCKSGEGLRDLQKKKIGGFCNRATHNLWVLLEEARQISEHLEANSYTGWYESHVENSTYKPLIEYLLTSD
jgi:hypothetical protein